MPVQPSWLAEHVNSPAQAAWHWSFGAPQLAYSQSRSALMLFVKECATENHHGVLQLLQTSWFRIPVKIQAINLSWSAMHSWSAVDSSEKQRSCPQRNKFVSLWSLSSRRPSVEVTSTQSEQAALPSCYSLHNSWEVHNSAWPYSGWHHCLITFQHWAAMWAICTMKVLNIYDPTSEYRTYVQVNLVLVLPIVLSMHLPVKETHSFCYWDQIDWQASTSVKCFRTAHYSALCGVSVEYSCSRYCWAYVW